MSPTPLPRPTLAAPAVPRPPRGAGTPWAAVLAGALVPVQHALNAGVVHATASPLLAAGLFYGVGAAAGAALLLAGAARVRWAGLRRAPPWCLVGGGLFGAGATMLAAASAASFGMAKTTGLLLAGQAVAGTVIDRFGVFGGRPAALTARRRAGLLSLLAAAWLLQGESRPWAAWPAALSGGLLACCFGVSRRLQEAAGSPLAAALVNLTTAFGLVAAAWAVVTLLPRSLSHPPVALSDLPWYGPVAGVVGLAHVLLVVTSLPRAGVVNTAAGVVLGQSLVFLCFESSPRPGDFAGAAVLLANAALLSRARPAGPPTPPNPKASQA